MHRQHPQPSLDWIDKVIKQWLISSQYAGKCCRIGLHLELAKFLMWLPWSLWLCFEFCYWNSQLLINGNYAKRINMNCCVLCSPLVCSVGLTLLQPVLYCQAPKLHGCWWRWIARIQSVQFSIILFRAWRYIWEARRQLKKAQCCSFLDLVPCKRLLTIKEALCSSFSKLIPCKRLFTIKEALCSSFLELIPCKRLFTIKEALCSSVLELLPCRRLTLHDQRSSVCQFYGACSMQETDTWWSKKLCVPVSWSLFYAEGSLQSKKPWVTVS